MKKLIEIDKKTKMDIERVKKYALNNPYRVINGTFEKGIIPGNNPNHKIFIQDIFRVIYSITVSEGIAFHHISISKNKGERLEATEQKILLNLFNIKSDFTNLPEIPEAEEILELFGIEPDVYNLDNVYYEKDLSAINLLKKIEKKS